MRIIVGEFRDNVPSDWMITQFQTVEEWKRGFKKWGAEIIPEPGLDLPGIKAYKFVIPVGDEPIRHFAVLIAD